METDELPLDPRVQSGSMSTIADSLETRMDTDIHGWTSREGAWISPESWQGGPKPTRRSPSMP